MYRNYDNKRPRFYYRWEFFETYHKKFLLGAWFEKFFRFSVYFFLLALKNWFFPVSLNFEQIRVDFLLFRSFSIHSSVYCFCLRIFFVSTFIFSSLVCFVLLLLLLICFSCGCYSLFLLVMKENCFTYLKKKHKNWLCIVLMIDWKYTSKIGKFCNVGTVKLTSDGYVTSKSLVLQYTSFLFTVSILYAVWYDSLNSTLYAVK